MQIYSVNSNILSILIQTRVNDINEYIGYNTKWVLAEAIFSLNAYFCTKHYQ
jgi:hypothetical protein